MTERLAVPIAGRQPAQYRLCAVIMHAGDSLDVGHYFSFGRVSGGCSGGRDDADDAWWRLDDTSVAPVSAAAALGPPCRSSEAAYVLLYQLIEAETAAGRQPALAALPVSLRAAVARGQRGASSRAAGPACALTRRVQNPPQLGRVAVARTL